MFLRRFALPCIALLLVGGGCARVVQTPIDGTQYGTAYSPRGFPSSPTPEDAKAFLTDHEKGRVVSFHMNWRTSRETAGDIPQTAIAAQSMAREYDIVPVVGFGWTIGDQPDLTSLEEPKNNSWKNAETRQLYREMVVAYAKDHKPPFLFLGNEVNLYAMKVSKEEWAAWVSVYKECYDAIKAVSPDTIVFTTFQYERLKGVGKKNGWTGDAQWQFLNDVKDKADAIGFTTYPYFEYNTPADIPADYYSKIKDHWSGPVAWSEIGWPSKTSGPYIGSEQSQADFVNRFFELTSSFNIPYVTWLFMHDLHPAPPSVDGIGLRTTDGTPKMADGVWRDRVANKLR